MAFKLTKAEAARKRELTDALRNAAQHAQVKGIELERALVEALRPVNDAVREYNLTADAARAFTEEVAARLRDEWDERSEKWQEGDAGQEALSMTEEWESVDLSDMDRVRLVQPDTLEGAAESAERLAELPEEPS